MRSIQRMERIRGSPAAKWGGNQFVAIWRQMKWGNEDLVVYELVNDKVKREEKIWPAVVSISIAIFINGF